MKHVIIIADGAADLPLPELAGRTPLEAAATPNLDRLAGVSRLGTAVTTPPGWLAGSDVCTMDLLGYDPVQHHTGRAPLEAAALGLEMNPGDWIFRLNLVTVGEPGTPDDGLMLDHSAGGISDAEARALVDDLRAFWQQRHPSWANPATMTLRHGVSYRSIFIDRAARSFENLATTPPHEIPRQPWRQHLPASKPGTLPNNGVVIINKLMETGAEFLAGHAINAARRARGQRPANMPWLWGHGTRPTLPRFSERFGRPRGAMITAVDLLAGIARLIGWDRLDVPGVTSYHDTDYAAQGRGVIEHLDRYDVICCHVESPDEASHQADWKTKVAAIEAIDRLVVGPVAEHLERACGPGSWRLMVLPDHYTLVSTRKHDATPVPFMIAGGDTGGGGGPVASGGTGPGGRRFTEAHARAAGWVVDPGHGLMRAFLESR
jgi:2,3-bisphosphoglycerate-independent phosphoglycerate mutase